MTTAIELSSDFFAAIKNGDLARLREILDQHPTLISEKPEGAHSAVLLAAYYGQSTVAEFLAPRVESLDIFEAAALGKLERVQELVEAHPELADLYAAGGPAANVSISFPSKRPSRWVRGYPAAR